MKRFLAGLIALLLTASSVFAMSQSSIPPKFGTAWGANAGAAYIRSIPSSSQIGIQNCAASLPDGFPPLTFVPGSGGGCPPFGQDFNGILRQLSQWNQWQAAGGAVLYDSAFSTAIGGYPNGAILASAITPGTRWMSTADNNVLDPDQNNNIITPGAGNWVQAPGQIPTGTPVQSLSSTVPTGYVSGNGLTIGTVASNATGRANADTYFLFAFVWLNCPNANCPIFNSAGGASTRGANAAADFAANKALAVHNMNGAALMGADSQSTTTTSFLVSVPVTLGSRTVPGSVLGENLHALSAAENGTHSHPITDVQHTHGMTGAVFIALGIAGVNTGGGFNTVNTSGTNVGINSSFTGITTTNNSGSGTAHNTVARSAIVYWNLKL